MRVAAGRRPGDDGHDLRDGPADVVDVSGAQTLLMRIVLRDPRVSVWAEAALIVVALAVATGLVYGLGGAPNTAVHAYYFPIIYAAVRFGRAIGLATATLAGIVCGPLMPMHVDTGERQALVSWLIRLAFFIAVSLVVYWLARQAPRPLGVMLRDVVWAQRLRVALRRGVVGAHFQPIVGLSSGESIGVEALCRWPDPRGGFYSPADFIPAAERTGVIGELGRHMLMTAAKQAAEWSARPGGAPMVTVNVSATQLTDVRFPRDLARAVAIDGFDPQRFCLEITETAIMTDPVKALAAIRSARELGLAIALDDFGTGYSSLAYLKDFPIDIIKIDQSFVAEVERDQKTNSLILAIIEMAKVLGAVTVAEGIERESQLLALRVLGCDLGQGWHLGRPVPATDPGLRVGAYRVDVAG